MNVERINKPEAVGVKAIVNGCQVGLKMAVKRQLKEAIRQRHLDVLEAQLRAEYGL